MSFEVNDFLQSMWSEFESERMRAVALRDEGLAAETGGDYDVLIHPDDLKQSITIIRSVAADQGWQPLFRQQVSNHCHLVFWRDSPLNAIGPGSIHLDLQDALGKKGFVYAQADSFIARAVYREGVRILRPESQTVALALHVLLDKGTIRPDYLSVLRRNTGPEFDSFAASVLPSTSARALCTWIRSGAPEEDAKRISTLIRNNLRFVYPLNLIRPVSVRLRRMLRYFGPRRGVLIAFLGPDGAGKSTILDAVMKIAVKGPFPLESVYMGKRDTFLPTSKLIRVLHRHAPERKEQNAPGSKPRIATLFLFHLKDIAGLLNWVLEQWARYLVQVRPYLQQDGLVLTDRYAFDLGNRAADSMAHKPFFRRLLRYLFPVPDRTYLLWEDPDVLYSRKPEMTIEQFEILLARLREIILHVPDSSQIRTDRTVEAIASQIASEIAALMESRCRT